MDWFRPSFENPVFRYGVAIFAAALLMGLLIVPFLFMVGGIGVIGVFISFWVVRNFLGAKTTNIDKASDLRGRRWARNRRRAIKADQD